MKKWFFRELPVAEGSATDCVAMVDRYIMSARGQWFFFGTGRRPFGMVNVIPDTHNAEQGGGAAAPAPRREQVSPMFRSMDVNADQQVTREEYVELCADSFPIKTRMVTGCCLS